ncbi:uncharacterized protein LOC129734199 [Falco cherrug]|uniref:uncharacterized protein LOC129734199 n=1 Tax=Falco cherrug TaxID=345164 RepID=UPI00247A175C|nr:uncharacterized protein LOC129734199 [Falco cherrug]
MGKSSTNLLCQQENGKAAPCTNSPCGRRNAGRASPAHVSARVPRRLRHSRAPTPRLQPQETPGGFALSSALPRRKTGWVRKTQSCDLPARIAGTSLSSRLPLARPVHAELSAAAGSTFRSTAGGCDITNCFSGLQRFHSATKGTQTPAERDGPAEPSLQTSPKPASRFVLAETLPNHSLNPTFYYKLQKGEKKPTPKCRIVASLYFWYKSPTQLARNNHRANDGLLLQAAIGEAELLSVQQGGWSIATPRHPCRGPSASPRPQVSFVWVVLCRRTQVTGSALHVAWCNKLNIWRDNVVIKRQEKARQPPGPAAPGEARSRWHRRHFVTSPPAPPSPTELEWSFWGLLGEEPGSCEAFGYHRPTSSPP